MRMASAARRRCWILLLLALAVRTTDGASCPPPNLLAKWLMRDSPACHQDCALTGYLNTHTDGMKCEAMAGGYYVYVFLNVVTMFAGIPSGKGKGRWSTLLARFFHRAYQLFLVVQIINQIFPMAYFILAFAGAVNNHQDCLAPFNRHTSLLSMVWVFSFVFHPFMLTNLALIQMFVTVLVETERVSSIVKRGKDLHAFWVNPGFGVPFLEGLPFKDYKLDGFLHTVSHVLYA